MVEIEVPNLQDWRSTSDGPLHVVFLVHLVLSSWSMLGFWSGNKLLLQNTFLLLCILWALQNKSNSSPIILSLLIDIVSILLDIIVLAVWYPHEAKSSEQFSAVMAIFNLIFRVASIYVIYQCWKERRDTFDGIYGTTTAPPASVISGIPAARSASRVSNRPVKQNTTEDTNGYGEIKGETFPDDDFVDQGTVPKKCL